MQKVYTQQEVLLLLKGLAEAFEDASQQIVSGIQRNGIDAPKKLSELPSKKRDNIIAECVIKAYAGVLDMKLSAIIDKI